MPQPAYITAHCRVREGTIHRNGTFLFGSPTVSPGDFLLEAYRHFEWAYPKFYKMDPLSKLGWLASEVLLGAGFRREAYPDEAVGVVLTNANASLDTDLRYWESARQVPSPALFVYTLPNIVVGEICIRNGFKGENAFFVSNPFDARFLENYVRTLFDTKTLQACLCGWVDVLGSAYEAHLMLVELNKTGTELLFTNETIDKTHQHG